MERITFLPLTIFYADGSRAVPMGDAILSLPLVLEGDFKICLPQNFLAGLIRLLSDATVTQS